MRCGLDLILVYHLVKKRLEDYGSMLALDSISDLSL